MNQPHPNNFCGCGFTDWLEVNLTPECNGKCTWCVERRGWHPKRFAPWREIADAAIASGRKNIILLGGEPTLHPHLGNIIRYLRAYGLNPWLTTNGSLLTEQWVKDNLEGVEGVNISIHHYAFFMNKEITGVTLDRGILFGAIGQLHNMGASVRFNCNCIRGYIDSEEEMHYYAEWAKEMGSDKVRFAELKYDTENFVDLANTLSYAHGLNDNPYICGCSKGAVWDGMQVDFRQMCGLQTRRRPCPANPKIIPHPVLYYDGNIYDGWQQKKPSVPRTEPEGGGSCVY